MSETLVGVDIPEGYLTMPLTDIEQRIGIAAAIVDDMPPAPTRALARAILPAAAALFNELASRGTRYCGIGRHLSAAGTLVTSCLTVSVYETGGQQINPRLELKNLVENRIKSGESGDIELIDAAGRPMLFSERVTDMPTPKLPGQDNSSDLTPTYQLEAVIPAPDGSAIAAIELSTAFVEHGPEFRKMIVDMAISTAFRPSTEPGNRPSSLSL